MAAPKKPGSAGRPRVATQKATFASLRGKPEFEEWFKGLVKHTRLGTATLLELAVIEYARNHGYEPQPPER